MTLLFGGSIICHMKRIPEISKALEDFKKFRGNSPPTNREIVERVMSMKGLYKNSFIEVDNETFRERGCGAYDGCACTGYCKELVPVSELDRICQAHYLRVLEIVDTEVETNLEAYTNG